MALITMTDLKNNLKKYCSLAQTEDVVITKNGKPIIKLVNANEKKTDIVDRLAGIISLDKELEEIMNERYSL